MADVKFPAPIRKYHIHVYFKQNNPKHVQSAQALRDRVAKEFPTAEVSPIFPRAGGPHLAGTFEVEIHTPALFGMIVPWMAVNHGDHSALFHPLTDDYEGTPEDHTKNALWLGEKMPLELDVFSMLTPPQLKEMHDKGLAAAKAAVAAGGSA